MKINKKYLLIIAVLILIPVLWFYHQTNQEHLINTDSFIVNQGDSSRNICTDLAKISAIPDTICLSAVKIYDYNLKFGEYSFVGQYSLISILEDLKNGKVKKYLITIPEGLTNKQIYKIINNEPKLSGDIKEIYPEGSFLPETYEFTLNYSRSKLLQRMNHDQAKFIAHLNPAYPTNELLNIAAIIEKEAKLPEERSLISSVYHNRLEKKMLLQADPTLIYDIRKGEDFDYVLTRKDINENTSGYNSYKFAGLPPTPICNPGKTAIAAAANPAQTNYLYFVSNNNNGHNFANKLEEHNRFVREYRRNK